MKQSPSSAQSAATGEVRLERSARHFTHIQEPVSSMRVRLCGPSLDLPYLFPLAPPLRG